jgi:hypothetical protein
MENINKPCTEQDNYNTAVSSGAFPNAIKKVGAKSYEKLFLSSTMARAFFGAISSSWVGMRTSNARQSARAAVAGAGGGA